MKGEDVNLETHQRVKNKVNSADVRNIEIPMPEPGCGPANRRRLWKLYGIIKEKRDD